MDLQLRRTQISRVSTTLSTSTSGRALTPDPTKDSVLKRVQKLRGD
jgi:hypothetical protein